MLISKREKLLFLLVLILAIALSGTIYINHNKSSQFVFSNQEEIIENEVKKVEEISNEVKMIGIHIGGQVKNPGFIWIEEGKRLYDALNYVGGALSEADLDLINLSKILSDEEKIYIPKKGETISSDLMQSDNNLETTSRGSKSDSNKVNINTASESELDTLPGIGPALAKRIVEHRSSMGLFKSIEDIRSINGIGEKRFNDIKDFITVR